MSVLNLPEVKILMFSGSLIVAANHMSFALSEKNNLELNVNSDNYFYFLLGSCIAIVAGGIYNDYLF